MHAQCSHKAAPSDTWCGDSRGRGQTRSHLCCSATVSGFTVSTCLTGPSVQAGSPPPAAARIRLRGTRGREPPRTSQVPGDPEGLRLRSLPHTSLLRPAPAGPGVPAHCPPSWTLCWPLGKEPGARCPIVKMFAPQMRKAEEPKSPCAPREPTPAIQRPLWPPDSGPPWPTPHCHSSSLNFFSSNDGAAGLFLIGLIMGKGTLQSARARPRPHLHARQLLPRLGPAPRPPHVLWQMKVISCSTV